MNRKALTIAAPTNTRRVPAGQGGAHRLGSKGGEFGGGSLLQAGRHHGDHREGSCR